MTGATGFIGTALTSRLSEAGGQVTRLPHEQLGEADAWRRAVDAADVVFHLAAQTSVRIAGDRPAQDLQSNVLPMLLLLESCRLGHRRPVVIFAGTATQFGLPYRMPVDESHADRPLTIYDLHKGFAEAYLRYYAEMGIVQGGTLRLPNVYGPGPTNATGDRSVLNRMIARAMAGEALAIHGDGRAVRDYVFVHDVARAFISAAQAAHELGGGDFVIGGGRGYTLAEAFAVVADRVALKTGRRVDVIGAPEGTPMHPIEARSYVADSSRFMAATGWEPETCLEEGIDLTIESRL